MTQLVFLLDQIQLGDHPGMVLELGLPHSEQMFNRVLHSLVDLPFMQNTFETFEDCVHSRRSQFRQHLTTLHHEVTGDLHRVLSRVLQQEGQQLQTQVLRNNLLINQMGQHAGGGHAHNFIVPFEGSLELEHHSFDQEVDQIGEAGVDHRDQGRVDVGETGTGHLSLDDGAGEESLPSDQVFIQQLDDDVLDVGRVHFVHNLVDRFPQQLEHQLLMLDGVFF